MGGYDAYIQGIISRYEEMATLMPVDNSLFDEMIEQLQASEAPTAMQTIISSINSYIISGGIVGLIVAGIVRREPQKNTFEKNDKIGIEKSIAFVYNGIYDCGAMRHASRGRESPSRKEYDQPCTQQTQFATSAFWATAAAARLPWLKVFST